LNPRKTRLGTIQKLKETERSLKWWSSEGKSSCSNTALNYYFYNLEIENAGKTTDPGGRPTQSRHVTKLLKNKTKIIIIIIIKEIKTTNLEELSVRIVDSNETIVSKML